MKEKSAAVIFALFLGGFGAHQFYLGKTAKGIFYLLFCWTLIPFFIGFIDFLTLLFMSSKKFDKKYNSKFTKKALDGLDKYLQEYPSASAKSKHYVNVIFPTLNIKPIDIGDKIQEFLYDQLSNKGLEEKEEIRKYLHDGLGMIPENFDESLDQIYFSTYVDKYLEDEALDPQEVDSLISKATELGIEKYQSKEAIKIDFGFYMKNWELDNGIFGEITPDFIMTKNEVCLFRTEIAEIFEQKEVTTRVSYSGPRARIRIAKGLSYSVGSYNFSSSKETKRVSKGIGTLNITTKRVLFKASQKTLTIRHSAIVDLEPFSNGLMIYKSSGNPILIKHNKSMEIYQAINGAIRYMNK
ncbi:TM2 domain-containing protein [Psychroserpens sp. XS_ASV72]|uniref:TM2 domain-containing protein n=1 Tax=Psychroserpens sp. XS_ASV72 TaxID=3241293 RepID=UPI0035123B4D